jgi:hypothetical protein
MHTMGRCLGFLKGSLGFSGLTLKTFIHTTPLFFLRSYALAAVGLFVTHPPTMGTSMRYFCGWRASSMMGTTLGRCLAMFTRSRPLRRPGAGTGVQGEARTGRGVGA